MSITRPMSLPTSEMGDLGAAPFTMQSWKWRSSLRNGLSQSMAGSVLTLEPLSSICWSRTRERPREKPVSYETMTRLLLPYTSRVS